MKKEQIYSYIKSYNINLNKDEFLLWHSYVYEILNNKEFLKRKKFKHHENQSVYEHSILVSVYAFLLGIKYKTNAKNCAIAGLLHDFYTYPWQYSENLELLGKKHRKYFLPNYKKPSFFKQHGFVHAKSAAKNSKKYFSKLLNKRISNAILTHMFPLSIFTKNQLPKYKESWIIQYSDKIITLKDLPNLKNSLKYIGLIKTK